MHFTGLARLLFYLVHIQVVDIQGVVAKERAGIFSYRG